MGVTAPLILNSTLALDWVVHSATHPGHINPCIYYIQSLRLVALMKKLSPSGKVNKTPPNLLPMQNRIHYHFFPLKRRTDYRIEPESLRVRDHNPW